MSQSKPLTSDTSNWCGTAVTTISSAGVGIVEGSTTWNMIFTIAKDNSITGNATGTGSVSVKAQQGEATAVPTGTLTISGSYDPGSNTVNLVLDFEHATAGVTLTGPGGSESGEALLNPTNMQLIAPQWSDMINEQLGKATVTLTPQCGPPLSETISGGQTQRAGQPWNAPPIEKVDGGTATKTITYGALSVVTVLTIYQSITIQRTDDTDSTFITTDTSSFTVNLKEPGHDPNSASWTASADSQNSGAPDPAGGSGATFSFTPSSSNPTTGSLNPNSSLQYKLQVTVDSLMATCELTQDEIDTLRQEYVDFGLAAPSRDVCAPCPQNANSGYNNGNYGYMLDPPPGMEAAFQAISARAGFPVAITGGFRCPQRNRHWNGSPTSAHMMGRALDLAPNGGGGGTMTALCAAAQGLGYHAFCEANPNDPDYQPIMPCGDPGVTHVHVDW